MKSLLQRLTSKSLHRGALALTGLLSAVALMTALTGCMSTSQKADYAVRTGFKPVSADTPERQKSLQELPADKFTKVTRNGKTYYVLPDKKHNTLYVGNLEAYSAYKQLVAAGTAAAEDQEMNMINQSGASPWINLPDYWNTWGTWGLE